MLWTDECYQGQKNYTRLFGQENMCSNVTLSYSWEGAAKCSLPLSNSCSFYVNPTHIPQLWWPFIITNVNTKFSRNSFSLWVSINDDNGCLLCCLCTEVKVCVQKTPNCSLNNSRETRAAIRDEKLEFYWLKISVNIF